MIVRKQVPKYYGKSPKTKAQKQGKMHTVMGEYKRGRLHSGSKTGPLVKSRAQAVAIGLSESGQSNKNKKGNKRHYKRSRGK